MLRQKHVPLERIKHVVFSEGVPEYGGSTASLRAITWKLLLDYLPPDRAQWDQSLAEQRRSYQAFVQELTTDPNADSAPPPAGATEAAVEVDASDHPLTSSAGSKWVEFHADEDLRAEIRKDVDRTLPDYSFFNREQPLGRLHHAAISRVLFIYAKLNPGIRYVQGMNEVLAPIYYVFCQEIDESFAEAPPTPTPPPSPPPAPGLATAGPTARPQMIPFPRGGRYRRRHTRTTPIHWSCCDGPAVAAATPSLRRRRHAACRPRPLLRRLPEAPRLRATANATPAAAAWCDDGASGAADGSARRGGGRRLRLHQHHGRAALTCSKLDHTAVGISPRWRGWRSCAKTPCARCCRLKVSPTFYGFRWITLLMTQEWELPDVLILWDSLLADRMRFNFLLYFCVATVLSIRDELIAKDDFAFAVKALQRFDARVPMHALLKKARALYAEDYVAAQVVDFSSQ